ncbi:MAG: ABC transporter substrate-binding protein [Sulfurospirillum sp.]
MKQIFLIISVVLLFGGCFDNTQKKELKISTNSWIGYAPLFYASKKGYLKDLDIKLVINVSLAESADVYSIGKADMVTTTQHEYYSIKNTQNDIVPLILIDRSYGGDMILSNVDINTLKKANKIYAYLEIDSINSEILKDFIKNNSIDENKMEFINQDQAKMQDIKNSKNRAIVIVTYSPYDVFLKKKSFKEVISTRDMDSIIVIDALCGTQSLYKKERKRLEKLKKIIDKSIGEIQKDKLKSYNIISPFLNDISYKEYIKALKNIKWINKPSKELLIHIKKIGYKEEYLIK